MIQDVNSAFSPDQYRVKLLLNCYTVAAPQTQVPPCAVPPSLVRNTIRPFGPRRVCTKRLIIRHRTAR